MSWKTVAAVLVVIFSVALVQSVLIGPLITFTDALTDSGDYTELEGADGFNGEKIISGLPGAWLDMGLIAIFGIMAWGIARILRRELTRGSGGL